MIGRAYRSADDMRRARAWQRADGRWDFEALQRLPKGGWYTAIAPASDDDPVYDSESQVLLHVGDWLMLNVREALITIDVSELTEGWPGLPPPYEAPEGAPEIEVGQTWRRGRQRLVVENVEPGERHGLRITTRNLESARESTGSMIKDRRAAAWTYSEDAFRAKFRLDCGGADTPDRERPVTKRRRGRGGSRG